MAPPTITIQLPGWIPDDWIHLLENRPVPLQPVRVTRDILRAEARAVLVLYHETNGFTYNPGSA